MLTVAPRCPAGQNRLLALNYVYPGEEPMVCAAHAAWGATFQRRFSPLPPRFATAEDRYCCINASVCRQCIQLFLVMSSMYWLLYWQCCDF